MLLRRDGEDNVKQPLGRSILSSDWILEYRGLCSMYQEYQSE